MYMDPIADLLIKIKNANRERLPYVRIQTSKLTSNILKVLLAEGYITSYHETNKMKNKQPSKIKITTIRLKYKNQIPTINGLKQISKPGLRIYTSCEKMPTVLNGLGIAIVSTSHGIMTNKQAKKANLGGEVIAYVW